MFKRSWFRICCVWSYRAADSGGPRGDGRRTRADAWPRADELFDRGCQRVRTTGLRSPWFLIGCVFVSLRSRAWAAALPFGQAQTGAIGSAAQSNSYTVSGAASDVLDFTLAATGGNLSPKIRLYNPAGTQLSIAYKDRPALPGPVRLGVG
jgi:hypothetical protein